MKTVFVNVRFLFCTLLLVAASNSGAVVTDVFTLKNGTILEGRLHTRTGSGRRLHNLRKPFYSGGSRIGCRLVKSQHHTIRQIV